MAPSIGYLGNTFYDVVGYFLNTRKMSIRVTQCIFMATIIVNCVGMYHFYKCLNFLTVCQFFFVFTGYFIFFH